MDGIKYVYLYLVVEVALLRLKKLDQVTKVKEHARNMSIAICLFLS